jgi:hypothetical protein
MATWGWTALRRERGLGRVLIGWGAALPVLPPLLIVGTWLLLGDAHPPAGERTADEPWPYWYAVGFFSLGTAIVATRLFLVVALVWELARPSPDSRQPERLDDPGG